MPRRIFISYQHEDRMKAMGFNLLQWSKNVDFEFVGRHLLQPVDSDNEAYIKTCIADQLKGTSVTVVLLGAKTHDSDWVAWEIARSLEKGRPNAIVAIRLEKDISVPHDSPVGSELEAAGAEIIDWDVSKFADAIERACTAAGRIDAIRSAAEKSGPICVRAAATAAAP
jgi:hypothetical protein